MTIVVLKVIALIFQRIERLIFDLPPRPATAHQAIDVACAYPHVGHPTEVLDLRVLSFPVLDEIDVHVGIGGIERHLIDKPKAVDNPGGAVVALIPGDAPSVLSRLDLLEQIGMIALFHPQDIPEVVGVQGLDMRSISTEAVFRDNELEVRMILAQLGYKAFGGMAFAI